MIEQDEGWKDLGVRHFKHIFRDDKQPSIAAQLKVIRLFPSFITREERITFTSQITSVEVERALKSFKKDKSLGPDVFPVEFLLAFFDLLGDELVKMVEDSRQNGRVLPSLNLTFIALIPKNDKPLSFADFHPISLQLGL